MSTAGDYRTWLRKFPKEPADRMATALVAVDAFENCQRKRRVTAADLRPLYFQILSDPNDVSFCLATAFMISPAAAPLPSTRPEWLASFVEPQMAGVFGDLGSRKAIGTGQRLLGPADGLIELACLGTRGGQGVD
jgi:hypothetical protein